MESASDKENHHLDRQPEEICRNEESEISQQYNEGKSWSEGIYFPSSWTKTKTKGGMFLQDVPVMVSLSHSKTLDRRTHPLSHLVYKVKVQHGQWSWSLEKRFHHFIRLHYNLTLSRAKDNLRRKVVPDLSVAGLRGLPGTPDSMLTTAELKEEKRLALERYLNCLLENNLYRENSDLISFLHVSRLSFLTGSCKYKEGTVKKRHGDFRSGGGYSWRLCWRWPLSCCAQLPAQWGRRWLMVLDTSLLYVNPETGQIKDVLLFDCDTKVGLGYSESGSKNGFKVTNSSRRLVIRCDKKRWAEDWVRSIERTLTEAPGGELCDSNKRFDSFAPVRSGRAKWFVDGCDYLACVAEAIDKAREEIFITSWWLTPELYLKRIGKVDREYWRLDEGIQVSILLYKEVAAILRINSMHSKRVMLQHPNIRVIRHPDHTPTPKKWAHHEKCVVVDQTTAFVSGIDMCFGRWDTRDHRLVDLGGSKDSTDHQLDRQASGGSLLEANRIINSSRPTSTSQAIQSVTMQLLAQHCVLDVAMAPVRYTEDGAQTDAVDCSKVQGKKSLKKSARSVMLKVRTVKKIRSMRLSQVQGDSDDEDDPDGTVLARLTPKYLPPEGELTWPGKDYVNWIVRDLARPQEHDQDNEDRLTTPRMPWHDIGLGLTGEAARDVARHFIQRWNHLKAEKLKLNPDFPFLVPKAYSDWRGGAEEVLGSTRTHQVKVQVLRSLSNWSGGQNRTEFSIMKALVSAINNAKHYVYMENQFFISYVKTGEPNSDVRNDVATAIYERILKAHKHSEVFRVFILLPLLPAFEGDIAGESGSGMRTIMHYQYNSISRGSNSLISRLEQAGVNDWTQYIGFYSLRTNDELQGTPVTELVYIHSKLCIVDDKLVICGSANINDRSLLGDRDSEVCVQVEDQEFIEGRMNGKEYNCGKFAGGLRKQLFKEHLGLLDKHTGNQQVTDPVSKDFFEKVWNKIASTNSVLYDELFSVIPTNSIPTLKASRELQTKARPLVETFGRDVRNKLKSIQGHLVLFPTEYLNQEDLQPGLAKEGIIPQDIWK